MAKDTGNLILTRREGEVVWIGKDVSVEVLSIDGGLVRLRITAPRSTSIMRAELLTAAQEKERGDACSAS